jgi:hypothetical protein
MVVVRLLSGLGNQMFQYACGRAVAVRAAVPLRLDISDFASSTAAVRRQYGLQVFNLDAEVVASEEVARLMEVPPKKGLAATIWERISGRPAVPVSLTRMAEAHFHFDPAILAAGDQVYLAGYFQSEKYFHDQADILRRDFNLRPEIEARLNHELLGEIERSASISLHIRRGDYVHHAETNRFFGVCSPHYYQRCIEHMATRIRNPVFFLFSDDPDWVKENLRLSHPGILASNGRLKDYEELWLMSRCRHHIIANSSFSWWGAWLNPRPDKIVCAPEEWFADKSLNTADVIPEGWMRY